MTHTIKLLLASAALALTSSASATLIGDTVTCSAAGGQLGCDTSSAVVGAGIEFSLVDNLFLPPTILLYIDIGASSISITLPPPSFITGFGASRSLTLASLDDSLGDILGIANFATAGTHGVTESDISFTAHSITFDLSNDSWNNELASPATASFDLVVGTTSVPEPAT